MDIDSSDIDLINRRQKNQTNVDFLFLKKRETEKNENVESEI